MCGITGIYRLDGQKIEDRAIKRFNDSLVHRGPDGSGFELFEDASIGLAHRRLSILDLSDAGRQPMRYLEGRYTITYNGEVFNFDELKNELSTLGYSFRTQKDTEVILAAYAEWKENCLHRFNGMWAFAIWDNVEKRLFVARDRYGIKPLYILHVPHKILAFASETNAFKYLEGYERSINSEHLTLALDDPYLMEGFGRTIYSSIYPLDQGSYMQVQEDKVTKETWYTLDNPSHHADRSDQEMVDEFSSLFEDAVKIRLKSDVDIATALSGGLDSSSVYAMLNKVSAERKNLYRLPEHCHHAFVAIFPDSKQDEQEYARTMVDSFGGQASYINILSKNLSHDIVTSTIHSDSISGTPLLTLAGIYRGARDEGYKVSMDGHGADELLYGYRGMVEELYYRAMRNGESDEMKALGRVLTGMMHPSAQSSFTNKVNNDVLHVSSSKARFKKLFRGLFETKPDSIYHEFTGVKLRHSLSQYSHPEQIALWHTAYYTLPTLLRDFDKASMMSGVEIRMPFMDYRLIELCFRMPMSLKVNEGYSKYVVRKAMAGLMPDEITYRTHKIGIQSPLEIWFNAELEELVVDSVHSKRFQESSYFDGKGIQNILDTGLKKGGLDRRNSQKIWKHLNAYWIIHGTA